MLICCKAGMLLLSYLFVVIQVSIGGGWGEGQGSRARTETLHITLHIGVFTVLTVFATGR